MKGVAWPRGFLAGACSCGIKDPPALDLGVLLAEAPCAAAGVFTRNKIKAAPVILSRRRLRRGRARAVVVNSGCANACTGRRGLEDAREMARLAAERFGAPEGEVLVASTGLIGSFLPMERIREGISKLEISREGGGEFARAILTTDSRPKERGVSLEVGGEEVRIGGAAKGAGMIHPDLATMLCFLTTDARIKAKLLREALREAVDKTFNMISVDGDTSPNDMVLIFASGISGKEIERGPELEIFRRALEEVCRELALEILKDAEGATRIFKVSVEGARTEREARIAARAVVSSSLVKAAVHGADPNWGRVTAALGRSGIKVDPGRLDIFLGDLCLLRGGEPQPFSRSEAEEILRGDPSFRIFLNLGEGKAEAWGCDLSEEYVRLNSIYTT